MDKITYTFKSEHSVYNKTIEAFTDDVLNISENFLSEIIKEFQTYQRSILDKDSSSYEANVLELLLLGTFWRLYGSNATSLNGKIQSLMVNLIELKGNNKSFKPLVKPIHHLLSKLFLYRINENIDSLELNLDSLNKLFNWLYATGEFEYILEKLESWKNFFRIQSTIKVSEYLRKILIFADWFKKCSKIVTRNYISKLDEYSSECEHQDIKLAGNINSIDYINLWDFKS